MCRRDTDDPLVRTFLDRYRVNLLALPGTRVQCGSVYVQEGDNLTAPGALADLVEPAITLPDPYVEDRLPDLSGKWSARVEVGAGIGLLENFLTALGAAAAVDELKASVNRTRTREVAFRFREAGRESLSPTGLGQALVGRRFTESNPWVREGNRYFVVAAVIRSPSISVQGLDERSSAVDLGAGIATIADVDATVEVERASSSELVYRDRGGRALAIGVELYELRWDPRDSELEFSTPAGPLKLSGIEPGTAPDPVFIGKSEDILIAPRELSDR